ncbi:MAG: Crp/Fnr family transcriptional regulator [Alteromonadaceae bacterium]|nr:MAG: Crp/Fnr family transcriptional regulator [Alteromonadaceae bacterium]
MHNIPHRTFHALILLSSLFIGISCTDGIGTPPPATTAPTTLAPSAIIPENAKGKILVFSKTVGFRHDSIISGQKMLQDIAHEQQWAVEFTENHHLFKSSKLAEFDAIVWLLTTGDVLEKPQQKAFRTYIETGGGYLGIHSASDTESDWSWYGQLVGAYFSSHPELQTANIVVENNQHPTTRHLQATWRHYDEWYNFDNNPRAKVNVLLSVDENSYDTGLKTAPVDHPITWYHDMGKGRAFYTALGHTSEAYQNNANFRQQIKSALTWVGRLEESP